MTKKTYILDTSVLINDPYIYKHFMNSNIIIPIAVLNELDKLKKIPAEAGKNARVAIKLLDEISNQGNISLGLDYENVNIKIDTTYIDCKQPPYNQLGDPNYGDTQILACLLNNKHATLVSNDINLRVKAKANGIEAISHDNTKVSISELYSGLQIINNEEAGLELQKLGKIDPYKYNLYLYPNECILFQNNDGEGIAMGRKTFNDTIKMVQRAYPWNLAPKNKEQIFAIDLLMDKKVDLVTLSGMAGCGKSLTALAATSELVFNLKAYKKLVIYRPTVSVDEGIGFLPGILEEKLQPWMQAIMDSFEFLLGEKYKIALEMFQKKGTLEINAISFIRGRSIPNAIILIDDAQNITPSQMKTILTRAGEDTKVIVMGDIYQTDDKALDATNNGLTYIIEKFKESGLAGHITFTQGERSRLASTAAEIL